MLCRKSFNIEVQAIFLDPDGRLVVLDENGSGGDTVRLVVVYALTETGRTVFFRCLEIFRGISHSLVLVGGLEQEF